jgi:2-succinyl-5-enolpyruvyl-6-hydroxy-3-cyclohexene-1-carboxylate synthase
MRTLACRAYWTALEGRQGVVHLNFPLREPLVVEDRSEIGQLPADKTGRPGGSPYVCRPPVHAADNARLRELVAGTKRGLVVAGRHERDTPLGQAAATFCEAAGWPLLADPLSGARRGDAAVAHYDALLRDEGFAAAARPDLVLRIGDLPVSKPLRTWLANLDDARQVALDPEGAWQDPASVLSDSLALEPADALAKLTSSPPAAEADWLASWRAADERAAEAILGVLGPHTDLSEPAVAAELGVLLPESATLFVASSMPVREIETFWPVRYDPPRVLCNRGANGIDGTVSSAFGAAAHGEGPVVLLIGDVALAHDIGGLLAAKRLELQLTIVLLDNGGGGIFDFLPVSRAAMAQENDIYTRHIATPTDIDFAAVAELYGLKYKHAQTIPALRAALEHALAPQAGSTIVHVKSDRAANVELHGRMWSAVSQACAAANPAFPHDTSAAR